MILVFWASGSLQEGPRDLGAHFNSKGTLLEQAGLSGASKGKAEGGRQVSVITECQGGGGRRNGDSRCGRWQVARGGI